MNKQITYLLSCVLVLFLVSSCVTTENGSNKDKTGTTNNGSGNGEGKEVSKPSGVYDISSKGMEVGSDMSIKIVNVQDSRCPTGTNCFVPGEAKILIEITRNGSSSETILKAKGICEGDDGKCGNSTVVGGQNIQLLNLYPYPTADAKIKQEDYTAKVRIN